MKVLHTADWHAGRTLAGRDRTPEIRRALDQLVALAHEHPVDLVVVGGDQFDSATPSAAAEAAVHSAFAELGRMRVPVVAIAGNHDSAARIDAIDPLFARAGMYAVGMPRTLNQGGCFTIETEREAVDILAAPFVSPRRLVRSPHLADLAVTDDDQRATYQSRMRAYLRNLAGGIDESRASILLFHGTMHGATLSSEFVFHSGEAFALPADAIPAGVTYAALGHIHEPQGVSGIDPLRARYSGSIIPLDFGEAGRPRGALLVDLDKHGVHDTEFVPLDGGRDLIVEDTDMANLDATVQRLAEWEGKGWIKLRVRTDQPRPGVKERLHRDLPDLLIAEFVLPEHEAGEPERIDVGEIDFRDAFQTFYRDQRGADPSDAIARAFAEVDDATSTEAQEEVPA